MINRLWILLCLLLTHYAVNAQGLPAQNRDTSVIAGSRLAAEYINDINTKADHIEKKLERYTVKTLRKAEKQDAAIKRKLAKKDSVKAASVFSNTGGPYQQLEQRLKNTTAIKQYIPAFDTLSTSLKFLQQNPQLASLTKESGELKQTISKVNALGSKLEQAEEIKRFLKERKQYLKDQLQNLGFAKQLKKLNKQTYYYSEQLNEYRSLLKDHKKAERKIIGLLSKTKFFQNFMRRNSMLASLFRMPGDTDDPANIANLAGLQTRAQVNSLIQQQVGTTGQAQFQLNMQDAQSQLQQLKDKVSRFGSGSSDEEMHEGFNPNQQKTKSFFKRVEYGTNLQTQKASSFFPVTSDLGLSVGYKLNDKSIIGLGASYKIGWGNGWKNINLTNQGVGLRSFIDWKVKGSLWLSGGYEQNYKTAFNSIDELRNQTAWQQSGLVGLSKVVSLKTKFFKKTKLQLLWDFLSYEQIPRTQPVIFRIGYSIK
ncbi:MAG: hypothetical protein ABI675_07330 [Chitinophagaceae bacterium]